MVTMTYAAQLKHPNWQRKRLEVLNASGFTCSNCGDDESMLHVHHRQYFKGRMAWEYESTELEVFCEECHKDEHEKWDGLKRLLSEVGSRELYSLCSGFHHHTDWIDRENIAEGMVSDRMMYAVGFTAWIIQHLEIGEMDRVAEFAANFLGENAEPNLVYRFNSAEIFGRATK